MVGGGLGSYFTEYYNSVGEYFSEQGVDLTNPTQLKAAFADDVIMDGARDHAMKRGIPIAVFDALSMGLAGRIAKPISATVRWGWPVGSPSRSQPRLARLRAAVESVQALLPSLACRPASVWLVRPAHS
jgi:hypothetical protein